MPFQSVSGRFSSLNPVHRRNCLTGNVTGQPPFVAPNVHLLRARVLGESAAPLGQLRPGTPRSLERVVSTCLQRDPDDRFQRVDELIEALREAAARHT